MTIFLQKKRVFFAKRYAEVGNEIIVPGEVQIQIFEKILKNIFNPKSTIVRIDGKAGTGKTTAVDLLLYEMYSSGVKASYTTSSSDLVSNVKGRFEKFLKNSERATEETPDEMKGDISFNLFQAFYSERIFNKFFQADECKKFNKYINNNTGTKQMVSCQEVFDALNKTIDRPELSAYVNSRLYSSNEFIVWVKKQKGFQKYIKELGRNIETDISRIGKEIYEDIRKLNDKDLSHEGRGNIEIGRNEGHSHYISQEILTSYRGGLEKEGVLDLSLESPSANNDIEDDQGEQQVIKNLIF